MYYIKTVNDESLIVVYCQVSNVVS